MTSVVVYMTRITRHRSIDAPAEVVWDVVTDPDVYAEVAPNLSLVEIVEGEGEGMIRRCVDTAGNAWTESCHRWDEGRGFAVTVDTESSEFHRRLFTRFEGEWSLSARENGVLITVRFEFDTKYGPLGWPLARYFEYKAPSLIEPIFDGWEAEIEARLAESSPRTSGAEASNDGKPTNRLYR